MNCRAVSRLRQMGGGGGLQVDHPLIGGSGGIPPAGNFDKQGILGIFRGDYKHPKNPPGYGPELW